MNALIVLVPAALALGGLALGAFLWSLRTSQYEDMEGAGWRAISDDDDDPVPPVISVTQAPAGHEPRA